MTARHTMFSGQLPVRENVNIDPTPGAPLSKPLCSKKRGGDMLFFPLYLKYILQKYCRQKKKKVKLLLQAPPADLHTMPSWMKAQQQKRGRVVEGETGLHSVQNQKTDTKKKKQSKTSYKQTNGNLTILLFYRFRDIGEHGQMKNMGSAAGGWGVYLYSNEVTHLFFCSHSHSFTSIENNDTSLMAEGG